MIQIDLAAIPNQSMSVTLSEMNYDIAIKETRGCMSITIVRDNVTIVEGQRLVAGFPAIPYRYKENGNFVVTTLDDDFPDYTKFNISQFLIYITQEEIAALRAST